MTTRRDFLKVSAAVGGGMAVGFPLPANAQGVAPEINAWVVIQSNDAVIIRYARSEMGQGSMTSAAQLVAEELECDWGKVRVEYADTNQHVKRKRAWGDMAAVGSRTIRQSQQYLRTAGATARDMLIAAAAKGWEVPAAECSAAGGVITHGPSGRKTTYGRVASAAAKLEAPKDVKLNDPKDWKIAGKPIKRVDIPDIVTGRIRYGIDAHLPGMMYAAIAQCPVFGGKVKSFDAARLQGRRGVFRVLDMGAYVAVVADNWWRAREALKELPIEWDTAGREGVSSEGILQFLRAGLDDEHDVVVAKSQGELEPALKGAARVLEAEYFTPYLAHATLEPQT
ncbi:MAG: molybdopterin cofactor-binding domain-containing protein, partial [Burkholderiales bacterium]